MGSLTSLSPDLATLPDCLDVAAETSAGELVRLVLTPTVVARCRPRSA